MSWLRRLWASIAAASGDAKIFAVGFLLLLPVYLAPLWVTAPLLPGLDLPFHLGLADMLSKAGRADSPYAQFYESRLGIGPYAAHYLALVFLVKVTPLSIASSHVLLAGLYVGGTPLAMSSLLRALGRSRVPALLAFPLAYNLPLHYGFVSFAFSLPVLLWLLAQLVKLLLAPDPITRPWLQTAALGVLLFLCHLQNFLYGVCAAGAFALFAAVPWRRRLTAMGALLPGIAALAWWQARLRPDTWNRPRGIAFAWRAVKGARLRDLPRIPDPWWPDIKSRLELVPNVALRAFHDRVEVQATRALLVVVAFFFVMALLGSLLLPGAPRHRARMRVSTWVAFAGVLAAYLLLPHHLNEFDIVTFFPRFAPLVLLMMLPLIARGLLHYPLGARVLFVLPPLVMAAMWGRTLTKHYQAYARETAGALAVLKAIPPGKKVATMPYDRRSQVLRIESAMMGMASFYPALKPAPGSMVPLLYCGMAHIPCALKPPVTAMANDNPWIPDKLDMERATKYYDYFFVRSPPPGRDLFGKHKDKVELVTHQGQWWLWKRKG